MTAEPATYRFAGRVPPGVVPIVPGPGQESVWDYPRPPRVEAVTQRVRVIVDGVAVADSFHARRVLETSHAPVYYIPREDVLEAAIRPVAGGSFCEWKGDASYWDIEVGSRRIARAAWSYERPSPGFESIRGHLAFYAARVDEALVGEERASPQAGSFYGGWVTASIVGPVKGEDGSRGW